MPDLTRPDYAAALAQLRLALGIPPDEPLFLLRGQDLAAAGTVHIWCSIARVHRADPAIVAGALEVARAMENWLPKKTPDAPDLQDDPRPPGSWPLEAA